jgi:hypothetical protein
VVHERYGELERGLSSIDAAFLFARRAARFYDFSGHVFSMPQFALTEANSDISVKTWGCQAQAQSQNTQTNLKAFATTNQENK